MKEANGFKVLLPSLLAFVFYGLCLTALTFAINKIDLSIVYAVWAGLGTALVALIGIWWYNEQFTLIKLLSIIFIIIGVVGLNYTAKGL